MQDCSHKQHIVMAYVVMAQDSAPSHKRVAVVPAGKKKKKASSPELRDKKGQSAYVVVACIGLAYPCIAIIVMAYIVMAYIVMACIYCRGLYRPGLSISSHM